MASLQEVLGQDWEILHCWWQFWQYFCWIPLFQESTQLNINPLLKSEPNLRLNSTVWKVNQIIKVDFHYLKSQPNLWLNSTVWKVNQIKSWILLFEESLHSFGDIVPSVTNRWTNQFTAAKQVTFKADGHLTTETV